MYQVFPLKRGDTFEFPAQINLPAGAWSVTSQVRDQSRNLIATLTVTLTPPVAPSALWALRGKFDGDTGTWPLGDLLCDFSLSRAGTPAVVAHSQTFTIRVTPEETAP